MLLSNDLFPYLAEPLPGELFISVLSRSARMTGENLSTYYQAAAGVPLSSLLHYPFLDHFRCPEAILSTTIYPYYFTVLDREMREEVLRHIRNGISVGTVFPSYPVQGLKHTRLRYCSECLKDDLKEYGTGYIRTAHQYDGVTCCLEHGVRLEVLDKPVSKTGLSAEDIKPAVPATPEDIEEARILTMIVGYDYEDLADCYRKNLEYLGIGSPRAQRKRILDNAAELKLNFPVTISDTRYKFLIGEGYESAVHPYFHMVMIRALAKETGSVEKVLSGPRKKCRNPWCGSENTRYMGTNTQAQNDYWKCDDCGMVFSPVRILQPGKKGKELLREAEKSLNIYDIIHMLGTTKESYDAFMEGDPEHIDNEIREARAKASQYKTRGELFEGDGPLYRFLRRFDLYWFQDNFPVVTYERGPKSDVSPELLKRDKKVLGKVREAYEKGLAENVWVCRNYLKKAAGVKKDNGYMARYFPETLAFIESHAETCEESWIRRAKLFIDSYDFSEKLNYQRFKKEMGGGSKYLPAVYRLLENYIAEKEREFHAV